MEKFDKVCESVVTEKIIGGKKIGTMDVFIAPYLGGMTLAFNINDASGSDSVKVNQGEATKQLVAAIESTGAKYGVRADKKGNVYISLPEED